MVKEHADQLERNLQEIEDAKVHLKYPKKRSHIEMQANHEAQVFHNAMEYLPREQVEAVLAVHEQANIDITRML